MRPVTFTADNQVTLLNCGAEYFPELIAAFDAARSEIYFETYIFALDETGVEVKAALENAARRGVEVHVITDWIGTGNAASRRLATDLSEAGVHYRSFNPWFMRGVARTHRKICVVDGRLAFLGGLNINNDYRSDDNPSIILPAPRWDFAVKIQGPLVRAIRREMQIQWARVNQMNLKARWESFKRDHKKGGALNGPPALAALVVRDNFRNRYTIQRAYLQALGRARKSAWLANPYFAPGRKLRNALASAAKRGVDVTLLLGTGQYPVQDAVAHFYYAELLASGVKIYEYRRTQLHGKVAVVDEDWATVGSSNYDGLSLFVNQEANIVVKDAAFAEALRRHIEHGVKDAVAVPLEEFSNIPWYRRAWYGLAYWFYKSVLRVITWGRKIE